MNQGRANNRHDRCFVFVVKVVSYINKHFDWFICRHVSGGQLLISVDDDLETDGFYFFLCPATLRSLNSVLWKK